MTRRKEPIVVRVGPDEVPAVLKKNTLVFGRLSAARKAGIVYERRVKTGVLDPLAELGVLVDWQPWFRVGEGLVPRFLHPDFLLTYPCGRVVVGDIKLRASKDGFRKILFDYARVINFAYPPEITLGGMMICKWYDKEEELLRPRAYRPCERLSSPPDDQYLYHIWNPRYDASL